MPSVKLKPIRASYTETETYRERGERMGLIRMLLVIDGKAGRFEFSHRIDESTAHAIGAMTRHILKGMDPEDAFRKAFADKNDIPNEEPPK